MKSLVVRLKEMKNNEIKMLFINDNGHVVVEMINEEANNYKVTMRDNRYDVPGYKFSFTIGVEETLAEALEMAQELCNDIKEGK